jgi:outer membrane lipoprotein-sorting protein
MYPNKNLVMAALLALVALVSRPLFAADDVASVLKDLDKSAANFRSTTADFEFDAIQTDPIPDKDVMKGTAYYERKGTAFSMAAHVKEHNGRPDQRMYMYSAGAFKLFQPSLDQVTTYKKANKYESYVMLGFGASGKELSDKWDITSDGQETLDGVKTEKLELVAKDETVRKNLAKVTIWLDTARAISLKQIFDFGQGVSRVCFYFNIKTNQALPGDAFKFKTDGKTQYSDQ